MKSELEEYKKKKKTKVFIETLMNYNIEADRSIIDFDYYKMKFDNVLDGLDKSEYYVQIPLEKKNELFEISNYNVILRNVDEIIKSENQILFLGQEWEMGFLNANCANERSLLRSLATAERSPSVVRRSRTVEL